MELDRLMWGLWSIIAVVLVYYFIKEDQLAYMTWALLCLAISHCHDIMYELKKNEHVP